MTKAISRNTARMASTALASCARLERLLAMKGRRTTGWVIQLTSEPSSFLQDGVTVAVACEHGFELKDSECVNSCGSGKYKNATTDWGSGGILA